MLVAPWFHRSIHVVVAGGQHPPAFMPLAKDHFPQADFIVTDLVLMPTGLVSGCM